MLKYVFLRLLRQMQNNETQRTMETWKETTNFAHIKL